MPRSRDYYEGQVLVHFGFYWMEKCEARRSALPKIGSPGHQSVRLFVAACRSFGFWRAPLAIFLSAKVLAEGLVIYQNLSSAGGVWFVVRS